MCSTRTILQRIPTSISTVGSLWDIWNLFRKSEHRINYFIYGTEDGHESAISTLCKITKTKTQLRLIAKKSCSLLFPHQTVLLIHFKNLCSRYTKLKNLVLLRKNLGFLPSAGHTGFQSSTSQWCFKASSTMWQSCIKIHLEKSQFRTLGLKLIPTFASGTGRCYKIFYSFK